MGDEGYRGEIDAEMYQTIVVQGTGHIIIGPGDPVNVHLLGSQLSREYGMSDLAKHNVEMTNIKYFEDQSRMLVLRFTLIDHSSGSDSGKVIRLDDRIVGAFDLDDIVGEPDPSED